MDKREKLHKLLDMCLDFAENYEEDSDKPVAMLYFSGHVNEYMLSLHENGWNDTDKINATFSTSGYMDEVFADSCQESLDEAIAKLEALR